MTRLFSAVILVLFVIASHGVRSQPGFLNERVSIKSGEQQIDGLLVVPEGVTKVPAIIFLGGSGPWEIVDSYLKNPKESYANFLSFYLKDFIDEKKVAFLFLNKRGFGKSTGKCGQSGLDERSDDALASHVFLKSHPRIDPARIAMIGHSQGGWVVQIAAARASDLSFVVSFGGPTVGVKSQTLTDYKNSFDCQFGKDSRKSKRAYSKKKFELGVGARIGRLLGGSAAEYARMVRYRNDITLKKISVPTLLIFGGNDLTVPARENVEYLNSVFGNNVPSHFTVYTGEKLNHAFHEVSDGCTDYMKSLDMPESDELRGFLTEYVNTFFFRDITDLN
jgi:uncharacterized protein